MSKTKQLCCDFVTNPQIAGNNCGFNDSNVKTLHKIYMDLGLMYTLISASSMKWALRFAMQEEELPINRTWNENIQDYEWKNKEAHDPKKYIDDDLLGYMETKPPKQEKGEKKEKGVASVRRSRLEMAPAVSMKPFCYGEEITSSVGGKKNDTSIHGQEVQHTRYQAYVGVNPNGLEDPERVKIAIPMLLNLANVGGGHASFKNEFNTDLVLFRITHESTGKVMYAFEEVEGQIVLKSDVLCRLKNGEIKGSEIIIGDSCNLLSQSLQEELKQYGITIVNSVTKAAELALNELFKKE